MLKRFATVGSLAAAAVLVTACDGSPTGVANGNVQAALMLNTTGALVVEEAGGDSVLRIEGSNGVLTISKIGFVIAELELEAFDGACDGVDKDDCPDFETEARFIDLPLTNGGRVDLADVNIAAGSYQELELEVKNFEDDITAETSLRAEIAALLTAVRTQYADFPAAASLVVEGDFNGTPFRVYLDAELEVELDFSPALVIADGAPTGIAIELQPALWFRNSNGTVLDLSQYNFATTGTVVEFDIEFDAGFVSAEIDD